MPEEEDSRAGEELQHEQTLETKSSLSKGWSQISDWTGTERTVRRRYDSKGTVAGGGNHIAAVK